jgi:hypothetical protein
MKRGSFRILIEEMEERPALVGHHALSGHVFSPGEDKPRFVFAVSVTF